MRVRGVFAAGLAGTLAAVVPAAATATFPGATGLVAFQSDRGGDFGIWTSNADASNPQPLYDRPGTHEFNPAWSPSGTHLVLQTGPLDRSTFDLVVVDLLTGEATPLLDGPENDRAAQFCDPDTIVFTRQADPANADIWTIGTDGRDLEQLTSAPGNQSFPTCSPNSRRIAYISNQTGVPAIWEMNADGSNQHQVVAGVDPDYTPDWRGLTYAAPDPADGNVEIFGIDLQTGATTQLTHTPPPIHNRLPHYAPDYPNGLVRFYYTQIDSRLAFPELNLGLLGDPSGGSTAFCGNPPPGPPGVPPNPPPGDPGGPKNNSAIAPQPTPACRLSSDGTLTVEGTEGPDDIFVRESADRSITVEVNGNETSYPAGTVTGIRIFGNGGNDRISTGIAIVSVPVTADGGAGIDIVFGEVTIEGTPNADRIRVVTQPDEDAENYGTTITLNGQTTFIEFPVDVKLEGFDGTDTVVPDRFTDLEITGWVFVRGGSDEANRPPNPVIRVNGTPKNDEMTIEQQRRGPLRITRNGEQAPGIIGAVGVRIDVSPRGGRDKVVTNVPINPVNPLQPRGLGDPFTPVRVRAGAGDDRVTCRGAGQRCTVLGGPGNDTLDVRDGTRSVADGGPGFDRVRADRADRVRRAETVTRG